MYLAYNTWVRCVHSPPEGERMRQMFKAAAIVACMMTFSGIGFAQCKIVVVDMQESVTGSKEGKDKATMFDAKVEEWKKKIAVIQSDLDGAQKKLQTQQSLASQTVIADLNKTIRDKTSELQRTSEDAQKDVDDYRDQLLGPVMEVAEKVMNELAMEKGYSIVYDLSAQNSPIVYSSKDCNITEEVKTRMNAKMAAGGPASTSTPARGTSPAAATPASGRGGTGTAAPAAGRGATTPAAPPTGTGTPRGATTPAAPPATTPTK
jgi:outer membrane protein